MKSYIRLDFVVSILYVASATRKDILTQDPVSAMQDTTVDTTATDYTNPADLSAEERKRLRIGGIVPEPQDIVHRSNDRRPTDEEWDAMTIGQREHALQEMLARMNRKYILNSSIAKRVKARQSAAGRGTLT